MVGSHVTREKLVEMVRELNNDNKVLSEAVEKDGKWRKRGYALIATSIILAMGVAGGVWWGYQERENNSSLRAEVASHNTVLAQKDSRVGALEKEVENLKRDVASLSEDRSKASKSADAMKEERDNAIKDLDEARSTIKRLEQDRDEKLKRIGELKEEIEMLEQDLDDALQVDSVDPDSERDTDDRYYYGE